MNFLNPTLLAALAPFVALPLVIHLFNRRFPLTLAFPDIERLRRAMSERSRLARWRHWVMTLLRTLAVAAALLAFLKPVQPRFGSDPAPRSDASGGRRVLLLVDRSLSLQHSGSGTSAARTLVAEAGKILSSLGGNDRVNVVLAGVRPQALLPEFSVRHEEVRAALAALPPSYERADVPQALALAGSLLQGAGGAPEIFVLSDFQRSNWVEAGFRALPQGGRVFFVDVTDGRPRPNRALLSVAPSTTRVSAGERVRVEVSAGNFTAAPVTLPVEAIVSGSLSAQGEIRAAPWSTGRTVIELPAPGEGLHAVRVRLPSDDLPADDERHFTLEVRRRQDVLVLCDQPASAAARLIASALDPWEDHSGPFAPRIVSTREVTAAQLAAASRLVLTGVNAFEAAMASQIAAFVEHGGGVVWFLDGAFDAGNLLAVEGAAGQNTMPFHLAGRLSTENLPGGVQKIARGDFQSRFLRLFRGTNRQALGLLDFYAIQRAVATGQGTVLLSYSDGTPALATAEIGLGTALLCNFSVDETTGNLARQRLFPAWMHDLVRHLSPEDPAEQTPEVGSTLTADVWQKDAAAQPVTGPDGQPVSVQSAVDGPRATLSLAAARPGIYSLRAAEGLAWAQAVNVSAEEADLRSIDTAELSSRAALATAGEGHFVKGADDYAELATGRPLFHWFVLALAALLALEMLLFRPFQRLAGHAS